ncbi:MAG: hypothetical protein WD872_05525 [Pirellulaceae bacterium]
MSISQDSVEAQRLSELEKEFGGKLFPAYNRGVFAADEPWNNAFVLGPLLRWRLRKT